VLAAGATARAMMIAPPPGPTRVALADAIVVGRVVEIEKNNLSVPSFPGAPANAKITYRVAVVQVADVVRGTKGMKTVRIGFIAPPKFGPGNPGGPGKPGGPVIRPHIRPGFRAGVQLEVGQTGLLYLTKHFQEPIYTLPAVYGFTQRTNANFDKEVEEARTCAKLLDNPMEGLKSADKNKSFLTAALLIAQYRRGIPGKSKTEPIDAEQSKLILLALANADWNTPVRPGIGRPLTPMSMFYQLGVTPKDGWKQPQGAVNAQQISDAMRTWLRENAGTFRIQRIVPDVAATTNGGAKGR
jgi:hypothetical protein